MLLLGDQLFKDQNSLHGTKSGRHASVKSKESKGEG